MRHLPGFIAGIILAAAVTAVAVPVTISLSDDLQGTGGTVIAGLGLNAAKYTDWIYVGASRSVTLDMSFTDGDDSCTAVTMVCETSRSSGTADDAGYEIHILSDSGSIGTSTSTQHTWAYTTGTAGKWQWTIDNIGKPYINCKFDATGTPAAADVITVYATGKTP